MMRLRLSEIARLTDGRLAGDDRECVGVSADTRELPAGALFVALAGERFDGHEFVRRAGALGAAGALVEREQDTPLPQVVVDDSLAALQSLAAAWRYRFRIPVVAVAGSNGKTTVKEMLAAVLARGGETMATRGNLNNHIGLPLTLLRLTPEHKHAVVELGANHAGEIAQLTRLARPDVGVITNAGQDHLEGFGSVDGVARANGELFGDLAADGVAVINGDDRFASLWAQLAGDRRQLRFGLSGKADVRAMDIVRDAEGSRFRLRTPAGRADVELPLLGEHNILNALAAATCAHALNVPTADIAAGLGAVRPVAGRLHPLPGIRGARVIDDSYNANPSSLAAAVDVLVGLPGEHWLVLGDMGELGDAAEKAHADAGRYARERGVRRLFAVGELSAVAATAFGEGGRHFDGRSALADAIAGELREDVVVLVKGSRAAGMETVAAALTPDGQPREAGSC